MSDLPTKSSSTDNVFKYDVSLFSPAIPYPVVFDVQERINLLNEYLDPKSPEYQRKEQHVNIKAAIKMYEDGTIDGTKKIHLLNGKVVTHDECARGPGWSWTEGGEYYQFAQKCTYDHGPFGPEFHNILMIIKLVPERGGDGTSIGINVMNDTGSNILTIFDDDFFRLGDSANYDAWEAPVNVRYANGVIGRCLCLWLQVQLVRQDGTPWSAWFFETAIIKQRTPGIPRLSGCEMRNHFYFCTTPGNEVLVAATTKGGVVSLI